MAMSWQAKVCTSATVIGVLAGGVHYLEPKTPEQARQEQTEQLSDAHEKTKEQMRQAGDDVADADRLDRLRPGERRLPEPPHFRIRLRP